MPNRIIASRPPPTGQHALHRPVVGGFDRLRHQLGQRREIGAGDGQRPGERAQPDHVDPDQRPDQRVHAAHAVQRPPRQEMQHPPGHHVARGQEPQRQSEQPKPSSCRETRSPGSAQRAEIGPEMRPLPGGTAAASASGCRRSRPRPVKIRARRDTEPIPTRRDSWRAPGPPRQPPPRAGAAVRRHGQPVARASGNPPRSSLIAVSSASRRWRSVPISYPAA